MAGVGEGWTVVRYGGGRQRFRQPAWDRGRGGNRGMDRAPPAPWKGRVQFPYPNQPVPPSGFPARPQRPPLPPRYYGPQARSYAEVVRGANPGRDGYNLDFGSWNRQQRRNFQPRRDQQTTPTNPKFGRLVRELHKVIKIVHHLQNVTGETGKSEPRMISRMVQVLASMIKPAIPSSKTADMIMGNAKNWGHTTLVILRDHYEAVLEEALEDLSKDLDKDWKVAFDVATRWARKNLSRLTRDVVDHAEALVAASIGSKLDQNGGKTTDPQNINQQGEDQQAQGTPQPTRRHTRDDSSQVDFLEEVVDLIPKTGRITARSTRAVSTMTTEEVMEEIQPSGGIQRQEQVLPPQPAPQHSPKEQRTSRRIRGQVEEEPRQFDDVEQGSDSLMDKELHTSLDKTPTLAPQNKIVITAQVHRGPTQEDLLDLEDTAPKDLGTTFTSTPQPHKFGPTRHIRTERKLVDWTVSVTKKWLFIGDSNLSRMPYHGISDLQIDSFPGANFRHISSILSKAIGQVVVEKIVISCGINSRAQKTKETTVKQLQTAVRMAKRRFPYSEIWIPLLNFSTDLPVKEQLNLKQLNAYLFKNMPYIGLLPDNSFQTEKDNIHWTKSTADAMFDHWVALLNLTAP